MADPTPEQLAELGVTMEAPPPLPRVTFEEVDQLPGEPNSDVKIRLETGEEFRERLIRMPDAAGFNFAISNALLDENGAVAAASDGQLKIVAPEARHEFRIEAVDMGKMSEEDVAAALLQAREIAAAKARDFFAGMDKGEALFGSRFNGPAPPPVEIP